MEDPAGPPPPGPRPYTNPYLAGVGLGLVLLAAFVLVGRGLGASGAFNSLVAWLTSLVAPDYAKDNPFLGNYLNGDDHPLKAWLVFELVGVAIGALVSGLLARRVVRTIERGPRISIAGRLALAFLGGALMAFGAAIARGCTSGQALTGGAMLNLGSWVFMLALFAGAYATAWFLRKEWR
ncbi:MAG: YeeE/YedE family protein [Deltaproteobacteria bacterium]|nr:YeeE/YedE family protein [Deltaproteobacteria bacterium]